VEISEVSALQLENKKSAFENQVLRDKLADQELQNDKLSAQIQLLRETAHGSQETIDSLNMEIAKLRALLDRNSKVAKH